MSRASTVILVTLLVLVEGKLFKRKTVKFDDLAIKDSPTTNIMINIFRNRYLSMQKEHAWPSIKFYVTC